MLVAWVGAGKGVELKDGHEVTEIFEATNEVLRGDGALNEQQQLQILFKLFPRGWQSKHKIQFNSNSMTFKEIESVMASEEYSLILLDFLLFLLGNFARSRCRPFEKGFMVV